MNESKACLLRSWVVVVELQSPFQDCFAQQRSRRMVSGTSLARCGRSPCGKRFFAFLTPHMVHSWTHGQARMNPLERTTSSACLCGVLRYWFPLLLSVMSHAPCDVGRTTPMMVNREEFSRPARRDMSKPTLFRCLCVSLLLSLYQLL